MGREVRRVPADWQHPTRPNGDHIPLFDGPFAADAAKWDEAAAKWDDGFQRGYGSDPWVPRGDAALECATYADWNGERPVESDYMPDWFDEQRTHFQMYENTSEGTPISPVMESPEALARWLVDNKASAFARETATYEQWLRVCRGGWAPSFVIADGAASSGVAALSDER